MLALHKAALDAERGRYEQAHGPIGGPQQVLRLVMDDPFFAWLRPLSDFVIQADIRLSDKKALSAGRRGSVCRAPAIDGAVGVRGPTGSPWNIAGPCRTCRK